MASSTDRARPEGRPPAAGRRVSAAVVLIVVAGLLLSAAGAIALDRANLAERQRVLDGQAAVITDSFEERIAEAVQLLTTVRGLFTVDAEPTEAQFQSFLRSAIVTTDADGGTRYDGFSAVSFIRHVRADDAEGFIARKRADGFGDAFDDVPTDTDSYVFSLHSSADSDVLGLDVRSIATRRTALERARDTGTAAVTEWVVPVTEQGVDPAVADQVVVAYLPVYRGGDVPGSVAERRAALLGWTHTIVRASELFAEAMPQGTDSYDVALYDGEPDAFTLVRTTADDSVSTAPLTAVRRLTVGESTWTLEVTGEETPTGAIAAARNPLALLATGVLLTALSAVLVSVLGRQRRRIEQQVIKVTAQLRHSEQTLRRMADAVPVGIFDQDLVTGEAFANQMFQELTAGAIEAWSAAERKDLERRIVAAVRADELFVERVERHGAGDDRTWLEIRATGVRDDDGNVTRLFGSVADVTADVAMETSLGEARDAALANARMKSEFLANMSHEIRTPLNGVIGLATLMLDDELSPKQQERLVTLREAGQHLLTLLNDILDFSKMEAGRLSLEHVPFSIATVIDQVTALYASTAHDRGLRLHRVVDAELPPVTGDPARLRQGLQNLVGNALKFTEHGAVEVRADLLDNDGDHCTVGIAVRDTGIGISPDAMGGIFEVFRQAATSTNRIYGGSGLGLAICKQIVERMGGTLQVDSIEGRGSTFAFDVRLPVADTEDLAAGERGAGHDLSAPAVADPAARPEKQLTGASLLLVEDNVINQQVALGMLAKLGYSADVAADGIEALDALRRARYDVVLMDCQMPRLDGYETTAHVRAMEGDERHTPIIAMTAAALRGDRERCMAAGMDDYISKPVTLDELADAIRRATSHGDQAQQQAAGTGDPVADDRGGTATGDDSGGTATGGGDPGGGGAAHAGAATSEPAGAAADEPAEPTAPPLDAEVVAELRQIPAVNGSVFDTVRATFVQRSAADVEAARCALLAQDWSALTRAVHRFRGAAGTIGAKPLAQRCLELERRAVDADAPESIAAALRAVEDEFARVQTALEAGDAEITISPSGTEHRG